MNKAQEEKDQRALLDNHQRGTKKFMFIVAITLPFIIALVLSWPTEAAEIEISSGVYTNHLINTDKVRNEDNNLIAVTYRFTDSDWGILGANFTNSYDVQTNAIAVSYSVFKYRVIELEVLAGVMKGYTEWEMHDTMCPFGEDSDICWFVSPKLSIEIFDYNGVKPKLSALLIGEAAVVTLGVSYQF